MWVAHGSDSLRCERHGEVFKRAPSKDAPSQCAACATDPGSLPEEQDLDRDLDEPIDALVEQIEVEQKLVESDLKSLRRRKVKAGWVYAAIGKLVDAKTKIWRARMEAARIRRDEVLVARREKRLRGSH